ncbi:magnesium/cobalt transporter CorA [soil metagenome]
MARGPIEIAGNTIARLPGLALSLPSRALGLGTSVPRRTVGAAPGTIPHIPDHEQTASRITVHAYTASHYREWTDVSLEQLAELRENGHLLWVDVVGVRDPDTIVGLAKLFKLHPLVQEDILHTHQRPKLDIYPADSNGDDQLFVVAKMLHEPEGSEGSIRVEQVGMLIGKDYLVTFQEYEGDVFAPVRERLRSESGRVRRRGADYLAYALLDVIIDHYFLILENLGDEIDAVEQHIIEEPRREYQDRIRSLRRSVIFLRRSIWPLREVLSGLSREDTILVARDTRIYLRDAYDHTIQIVDIVEGFRDVLGTLSDLYLSSLSHRLNEVMKVLTIVGTVFIPLSFFAGIYGMNFEYMPELSYRYGYFVFLGVVAALLIGSFVFFRRKKWI